MRYDHFSMLPIRAFQKVAGRMTLEGGGKGDTPDAPDYTPMANASAESARLGAELGREQLAENKRQYENNMAVAKPVVDAQLALMDSQKQQGDDYYKYQKETFRPLEQGLVDDANAFSEAGAKEQFARQAAADLQGQQANQMAQNNRAMASMGVNPNSGKFQAISSQQGLVNAAQRAGATSNARVQADSLSTAKKMEVAGLGRGLSGAAQGSYGLALNAGNAAVGNNAQAGNSMVNGMNAGTNTIMNGQGQRMSGLGSIMGSQTSIYNANQPTDNTGAAIGALGGIGMAMLSDRRLKDNIVLEGIDETTGLNLYSFNYTTNPDRRFIGVMADEVEKSYPDAVQYNDDGFASVRYGMLGLDMKEVSHG